jgi:hypothetical protein
MPDAKHKCNPVWMRAAGLGDSLAERIRDKMVPRIRLNGDEAMEMTGLQLTLQSIRVNTLRPVGDTLAAIRNHQAASWR